MLTDIYALADPFLCALTNINSTFLLLTLCAVSLMAPGPPCLAEELWHALPRCPTSSGRWDIKTHGANLAEEKPQHLVCVDPGH
jgi:hypothetical protein